MLTVAASVQEWKLCILANSLVGEVCVLSSKVVGGLSPLLLTATTEQLYAVADKNPWTL